MEVSMADRIKGITVEIGGDTTKLTDALKDVNKAIKDTQTQLRDVNKLLKLDPGNADLLVQKQKYLSEAIKDTKEKLKQEQDALKQLKDAPQTEETVRQQEALTREIESTKQALKGLEDEYKSVGSIAGAQLEAAGQKIKDVGGKITDAGTSLTRNVTAPIAGLGAATLAAFNEVDEGADIVTQKTGATGQALKDMQESANEIATSIPTDFETAGSAIGEVNTRFGLTGDALQSLSQRFVEFATLNNTDVKTSVDNVSSVLNAFGMSTDQAGGMLDVLNSVGQSTGLSMDTLASDLSQNAAQLQSMGLNATQSAQFLGNVEMSGLDAGTAMAAMKKAMKNAADDGKTLDQSLAEFSDTMKSNASETEKLQAAYDLFGSKGGASIYNAMQTGKLSFDGFSSDMSTFAGNVENTFNDTLDPIDKFKTTLNQLKVTGADVGNSLASVLAPMLEQLSGSLKKFSDFWSKIPEPMQQFIIKAALVAAAVGPILVGVGKVTTAIGSVTEGIGKVMKIGGTLSSGISLFSNVSLLPIIGIIAAVVAAIGVIVFAVTHWGEITEWFKGVWDNVCEGVKAVGEGLADFFTGLWDGIKSGTEAAWNGIKTGVSNAWEGIKSGATTVFNGIKDHISDAWNTVKTNTSNTWSNIKSSIQQNGGGIKGVIKTAVEGYKNIWKAGFEVINKLTGGKLGDALSAARNKLSDIKNAFSEKMNGARDAVKGAIDKIKGFFNFHWSLPKLKMPHFSMSGKFSLDPPSVPHLSVSWYKKAMDEPYILNSPTLFGMTGSRLLGGGEAGEEAVVGTSRLAEIVTAAVAGAGGGDIIIPVYIGQDRIDEIVVKATQRANYRSGGR
jgi:phage-related minor tail protein